MANAADKGNEPVLFLRQDAQNLLALLRTPDKDESTGYQPAPLILAMTPSGGIAARSGTTVSSATCNYYRMQNGTLSSASGTITVYNLSTTAVGGSKYIIAARCGGGFFAVWEDC